METPPSPPQPQSPSSPERKSGGGKKWLIIIPVLLGVLVLACGGCLFGFANLIFGTMKNSEPYKESLARASGNAEVIAELGTPVEAGFWVGGNFSVNGAGGEASLTYTVKGPKGKGTVYVEAEKTAGRWDYSLMEVEIEGRQERVNLLGP